MLLEFLIAIFLGIFIGTITGLTPGIHINLVAAILLSLSIYLLQFTVPIILVIFIVSMSITHIFIDFIPSIFLGAPDENTILSILPGHEMLKEGNGYQAVYLSVLGCLLSLPIIIIISILFIIFLPLFQDFIRLLIPFVLIFSSFFLIIKEKNKLSALIIFILSGFLGIAVLNSNANEPLLPLLTGLFGVSSLLISIKTKAKIPEQIIKKPTLTKKEIFSPLFASFLISPLCSFIPALGGGQASIIVSSIINSTRIKFMIVLGSTSIITLSLSFIVLYSIEKSRTGAAVIVSKLLPQLTFSDILIILIAIIITSFIGFYLTLFIAKKFSLIISKINYSYLSIFILFILFTIILIFSGFYGILILLISTSLGIYGIQSKVKRINLMGCLLLPTILIYLI